MEVKVSILVALIGLVGALVGGVITAGLNYYFGLASSRHGLLQDARRATYSQWLEVRTLSRQVDELRTKGNHVDADKIEREYDKKGREVMGKIATYGGQKVVKSVAQMYRTDPRLKPCTYSSSHDKEALAAEISAQQVMRRELVPEEDAVSDADMAVLLLQCDWSPANEDQTLSLQRSLRRRTNGCQLELAEWVIPE